jgi:periplasmic protein TonB
MATTSFPLASRRHEGLGGSLVVSVLFHAALGAFLLVYPLLHFRHYVGWGTEKGRAIRVNAVNSLPGIPLPRPSMVTPSRFVLQNPGLYESKPQPLVQPPKNAVELPKFKDLSKRIPPIRVKQPKPAVVLQPQRQLLLNKRIQKQTVPPPPNAIPTGAQGAPAMNYGQQIAVGNTTGKLVFNGGAFGSEYGWYVDAVKNRISSNWLLSLIDPALVQARRVYVEFDIQRNGAITGLHVTESSGYPEVDRSAERAVLASSPLPALPGTYHGNSVHVIFYFDYHR